jgi:hypothetical protein
MLFLDSLRGSAERLSVTGAHRYPASLSRKRLRCGASNPLAGGGNNRHSIPQTGIHGVGIIKVWA